MSLLDKLKKLIFVLIFTLTFVSVIYAAENKEKEIYITRNIETGILMAIDENGKILAKSSARVQGDCDEDDNFTLYKDLKDEKVKLIYESTYGEEAEKETSYETFMSTGDGSEYTEEYSWWTRKKFNYYFDLEGNKYENVDREDGIQFLYDGYGLMRNNNDSSEFGRIYDFNKKEYKKYDVDIMRLFLLNDKLYGTNADDNFYAMRKLDTKFYTFDDEMNIIKIMNYDEWSESNGEDLDYTATSYSNGSNINYGKKGDTTYLLDKNKKILSAGYKCDYIKKLNEKGELEDSIYARTDLETITFFTLKRDILTMPYDYKVWENLGYKYYDYNKSTIFDRKVLVGTDPYYIVPDNNVNVASSSVSYIYKATKSEPFSNVRTYFTSDELFEVSGPTYYLYDFYIYYNTIIAKYKDLIEGAGFWYYKNLKTNEEFSCREVLNAENLQMMERPIALITFNLNPLIKAYDVKTGELVKTFNRSYDSNSLRVFKCGNKSLNLLKKIDSEYEGYADVYDVYDKDLKLINTNIEIPHNYGNGKFIDPIIDYRKYEKNDDFPRNEQKMVEKYYCVSDFDNNLIMKEKDGTHEIFILGFKDKSIIQAKNKKEGTYVLYDEKGRKLINNDNIKYYEIFDDILIASDDKKTYIYDQDINILKTIDYPILYARRYQDFIVLTDKNYLESLLDKDYNFVGEKYKNIDMHDNFYVYEDNFKIYLKNLNHKLICEMSAFNGFNEEDDGNLYN